MNWVDSLDKLHHTQEMLSHISGIALITENAIDGSCYTGREVRARDIYGVMELIYGVTENAINNIQEVKNFFGMEHDKHRAPIAVGDFHCPNPIEPTDEVLSELNAVQLCHIAEDFLTKNAPDPEHLEAEEGKTA